MQEIVGVVASVKQDGLAAPDGPEMYAPVTQSPASGVYVAVRSSDDQRAATRVLRQTVATLDPTVPVSDVEPLCGRMLRTVDMNRFCSFLASLFAIVGLILGAVGIYSVLAYIVTQGRREIAVRVALGASPGRVMGDVLRRALGLAAVGIALGSLAAWLITRALTGLFQGVSPHDPGVFIGSAATFVLVALVAASVPTLRTTRISPVLALASS